VINSGKHDEGTYTLSLAYTSAAVGNLNLTNPNNNITGGSQTFFTGTLPNLGTTLGVRTMTITGTPYAYNPANGNLLLTVMISNPTDQKPPLYLDETQTPQKPMLPVTTNAFFSTVKGMPYNYGNAAGLVTGFTVSGPLMITTTSLPSGNVGVNYSQTLMASGGAGGYTWSATGLPPGLTISAAGSTAGVLSGVPMMGSTTMYSPTFMVTDSSGTQASASLSLTINPSNLMITTSTLPGGVVGQSYSTALMATGGVTGYTWSATGLPNGLTINSVTGVLSGYPMYPSQGSYTPTFTVTDSNTYNASATIPLTITLAPLQITGPSSLPNGDVGLPYSQTFTASGGTGVYIWSVTGLPNGLSLSTSSPPSGFGQTGSLSGTPNKGSQGSYTPVFTVTDSSSATASIPLGLTIKLLPLQITGPSSLSAGTVNVVYNQVTFTATGGTFVYTWSATGLPPGLMFSSGGMLNGTPNALPVGVGQQTFMPVFTVTDSSSTTTSTTLSLTINAPPLQITGPASLPSGAVGVAYGAVTFSASGGSSEYNWSATGLPGGLTITTAGVLSGTPASGGSQQPWNPAFTVTDTVNNNTASVTLPLPVSASVITLYSFEGGSSDGAAPRDALISNTSGAVFGTTFDGGANGAGTLFRLMPPAGQGGSWTETVLYSFPTNSDGAYPIASLIRNSITGTLYGTTSSGGSGWGTVFQVTQPEEAGGTWTESVLYGFTDGNDGASPYAGLLAGPDGVYYGTAYLGGADMAGTVFQLTPPASPGGAWTETTLYSFTGGSDGGYPYSGLTMGQNGVLYGTTSNGGMSCHRGCGTVFSLTPPAAPGGNWTETVLYMFMGGNDGANPTATLLLNSSGALYGTTSAGGPSGAGTVFELTAPSSGSGLWTETVVYNLTGANGATPYAGLFLGSNGALWGTTVLGGVSGDGTVFELTPTGPEGVWVENVLNPFMGGSQGSRPLGGLLMGSSGVLYGTTVSGGASGNGTVFEVMP
jgi:uncharacterized repeat protein (TIGR03803 family)